MSSQPHPTATLSCLPGYAAGEKPIPDVPVIANIKDYGAVGDGRTDDSAAFLAALRGARGAGAIYIPAGEGVA